MPIAALLVDEVLPRLPLRQWMLSVPYPLRLLFAREPKVMSKVLSIVYRTMASQLMRQAGLTRSTAHSGAVTLIQRFGSELTKSPGASLNSRRLVRRVEGRVPGIA